MLELNLSIRFVAFLFLFLSSTCFTSLVQSVCNRSNDLVCLYYAEQRNNLASNFLYINTNTSTSNVLNYNPNRIPSKIMYKKMHKRDANLTSAVWIRRQKKILDSRALRQKKILDSRAFRNKSRTTPLPENQQRLRHRDLHRRPIPAATVHLPLNSLTLSGSVGVRGWQHTDAIVENSTIKGFVFGRRLFDDDDQRIPLDVNRNHPPIKTCSEPRLSHGATAGITLGVLAVLMSHARCLYNRVFRKKKAEKRSALLRNGQVQRMPTQGITIDKAVEFSYEELSKATNDFSLGNKIGQGGFGAVYYAELRGEKVAIKKMDMQASKEFLAELKVLTHVHHLSLVRLTGYCVEGSHFLVYDYIENGNLSQHLHGSGRDPLPWPTRVQIALDSARGLEYIHEYTVSVFIHCDIKSANILIDRNFNAKVADFGLTRLTEVGSRSRLVGTFGYMSPEYAQYGDVSPKVDVYAFGVVLYELISAKEAIIRANGSDGEPKGLIALFDEVLSQTDLEDGLVKMIDPRLGDNYPLDSVYKMAQLAKACTHEDPQRRPHMRSIVVALMNLSSSMED